GMSREQAKVIATCLVHANLRGVDTHGVARLPQYCDSLRNGKVNPTPKVRAKKMRGATGIVDADGGYGFVPTSMAAQLAIDAARNVGIAAVGVRNSRHFGMAAYYGEAA